MTLALLVLLKLSVTAIILAIGMDSTATDVTYLWRRPRLMARSLLAMYVLVPLATLALVHLLAPPPAVRIGLLVVAVSAGAPLLPRKLMRISDSAYVFSLVLTSSLFAIVLVPAWLVALGPYLGAAVSFPPQRVALVLAKSFLLPLAAGMLVRRLLPAMARAAGSRLMVAGGLVLTASAIVLLALNWDILLAAHLSGVVTLAALIVVSLLIGHVLGGPAPADRTALAVACATRHIGIAVLVAAAVPGPRTLVMVAFYALTCAAITLPYLRWQRSRVRPV